MSLSCVDPRDDRLCDPWEAPVSMVFTVPSPGAGTKTEDGVMPSTLFWCVSDLFQLESTLAEQQAGRKGEGLRIRQEESGYPVEVPSRVEAAGQAVGAKVCVGSRRAWPPPRLLVLRNPNLGCYFISALHISDQLASWNTTDSDAFTSLLAQGVTHRFNLVHWPVFNNSNNHHSCLLTSCNHALEQAQLMKQSSLCPPPSWGGGWGAGLPLSLPG